MAIYNEQIEELITAALADGVLTEKEKQVLFKKAQAMGIDLDEFEMVLDARLVELEKSEKERATKAAPKSNKIGDVRKCPQCGAVIGSFQMICPECGFEFNNVGPNAFVEKLSSELRKITGEAAVIKDATNLSDKKIEKKQDFAIARAEAQFVKNYPLPMTKEDCVEMLNFIMPKTRLAGSSVATRQWRLKADAILDKMENENPNNAKIQELCRSYRDKLKISFLGSVKLWYTSMSRSARTTFWVLLAIVIVLVIDSIGA